MAGKKGPIPGIIESNGRYYRNVRVGAKKVWVPLTRVDEGRPALLRALADLEDKPPPAVDAIPELIKAWERDELKRLTSAQSQRMARLYNERIGEQLAAGRGRVYADAVLWAVATAMRRGEICGLLWSDVDEAKRLVLVRDRKDPRKKAGNDQWVPLLPAAWEVLQRQPRTRERVWPIEAGTLSKYFTDACRALSIPDLHLHDMRHEGTSQLFEQGYEIQQVALATGHKKWDNLRRYTQLRPEDLHRSEPVDSADPPGR